MKKRALNTKILLGGLLMVSSIAVFEGCEPKNPDPNVTPVPILLAPEFGTCSNVVQGETWSKLVHIIGPLASTYSVLLASDPCGINPLAVDDALTINCVELDSNNMPVTGGADSVELTFNTPTCSEVVAKPPVDVTQLLNSDLNVQCEVIRKDLCGACKASTPIFLVYVDQDGYSTAPECDNPVEVCPPGQSLLADGKCGNCATAEDCGEPVGCYPDGICAPCTSDAQCAPYTCDVGTGECI